MASNSNSKINSYTKTPSTTKPKKPSWIRSCFGFGSSHKTRVKADRSSDEVITGGGKRMKGLGILRGVVKRPWAKKKDKTTSLKTVKAREKVVEGSKASKVVVVVGKNHKTILDHDQFHETQWPIGGHTKKEFDCAKDVSPPTPQTQSKIIKEDTSISHRTKVMNKADSKERDQPEQRPDLARVSSKQSRRQSTQRSNMDGLIGMSILITVLMVMLLCGRLCAILCTAIWFYCMPRLNKTTNSNKNNVERTNSSVKLEDERKEVVLRGFLERKHNSIPKG